MRGRLLDARRTGRYDRLFQDCAATAMVAFPTDRNHPLLQWRAATAAYAVYAATTILACVAD
jgi:hypothetical protein